MKCIRILVLLATFSHVVNATASYAIYVGKNLTEDGSVFIGGSGDEFPAIGWKSYRQKIIPVVPR
jgi:hypothetical protein